MTTPTWCREKVMVHYYNSGITLRILTLEDNSSNNTDEYRDEHKITPFCRCLFILVKSSFRVCRIYEALWSAQLVSTRAL